MGIKLQKQKEQIMKKLNRIADDYDKKDSVQEVKQPQEVEESNLFDTKMESNPTLLLDLEDQGEQKKYANRVTTLCKEIRSIESFQLIEQQINEETLKAETKERAQEKPEKEEEDKENVDQNQQSDKPVEKLIKDTSTGDNIIERINKTLKRNSDVFVNDAESDDSIIKEDDENDYNLDNYASPTDNELGYKDHLYDELLGCYYDPVTNEYYSK